MLEIVDAAPGPPAAPAAPTPVPRRRRLHRTVVVAAITALFAVFAAVVSLSGGFFDLHVYDGAVSHWAHGGNLYAYQRGHSGYGFTYPPFAALTMLPMAVLPWPVIVVVVVSTALSGLAVTLVLYWLTRPLARRRGWDRWLTVGGAVAATVVFEPVRHAGLRP